MSLLLQSMLSSTSVVITFQTPTENNSISFSMNRIDKLQYKMRTEHFSEHWLVHGLMQVPSHEEHGKVHGAHCKYEMEEPVAIRHFVGDFCSFLLFELQTQGWRGHNSVTIVEWVTCDYYQTKRDSIHPLNPHCRFTMNSPCRHPPFRKSMEVTVAEENTRREFKTTDERWRDTEKDAESNPVVKVAKIMERNAMIKLCTIFPFPNIKYLVF